MVLRSAQFGGGTFNHPGYAQVDDSPVMPGAEALRQAGLSPITLESKEGLALINGTQPSTAVAALAVLAAERLARAADVVAALSIDALRGSMRPFDARIHDARPHPGQQASAANIRSLLEGSAINASRQQACARPLPPEGGSYASAARSPETGVADDTSLGARLPAPDRCCN